MRVTCFALAALTATALRMPAAPLRSALQGVFVSASVLAVGAAPLPALAGVVDVFSAAGRANEVTYSNNGKNLARMATGDYTMGTKLTSTSERGLKRRAIAACKSPKVLAAIRESATMPVDEAACTRFALDGDTAPILAALEQLGDQCKVDATHVCL